MKAMILAAGRGERMRPMTDLTPKPLLPAGGQPLIVWTIERLRRAGIDELVINVSHLGEQICEALGDGRRWGVRIAYTMEPMALETAGGIANALPLLGTEPFIATAADLFSDFDFGRLRAAVPSLKQAHLVLVPNPPHHAGGDFVLEQGIVRDSIGTRLTFSGTGLYRPDLFKSIVPGTKGQLATLLRAAMARQEVTGELHRGAWRDIGTPERLTALDRDLASRREA
jgi:N-acetyl-alpha-D-muramate 1-phosphate uridylyltransferase